MRTTPHTTQSQARFPDRYVPVSAHPERVAVLSGVRRGGVQIAKTAIHVTPGVRAGAQTLEEEPPWKLSTSLTAADIAVVPVPVTGLERGDLLCDRRRTDLPGTRD
jgi:hypothetical protein